MKYDLEERTAKFAEKIVELCKKVPKTVVTIPVIDQLVRSGTSIGASSRRDFKNKVFICKKESNETKYWLRILAKAYGELAEECRKLWQEAQEYTLIFSKIAKSTK